MSKIKEPKIYHSTDLVLQEVWNAKDKLSASYGHDVNRLFAEARRRQKDSGHRVVNLQDPPKKIPRKTKGCLTGGDSGVVRAHFCDFELPSFQRANCL